MEPTYIGSCLVCYGPLFEEQPHRCETPEGVLEMRGHGDECVLVRKGLEAVYGAKCSCGYDHYIAMKKMIEMLDTHLGKDGKL